MNRPFRGASAGPAPPAERFSCQRKLALALRRGLLLGTTGAAARLRAGWRLGRGKQLPHDVEPDGPLLAHDAGPVDDVAKLADVAGPVVPHQQLDGLGVPARHPGAFLLLDVAAKM